jgi:hypothetical protein
MEEEVDGGDRVPNDEVSKLKEDEEATPCEYSTATARDAVRVDVHR